MKKTTHSKWKNTWKLDTEIVSQVLVQFSEQIK